ncbi:MAG: serine/threonine protein kinase [Sedimentisphaerales bacterium]|nr:serine/threonine protein kinase [Sedimentisphaerales bacterium]
MMNETNYDTMFGKMAVEQGLCTNAELHRCLEKRQSRRKVNPVGLEDLMIDLGYVTLSQAQRLKDTIKESKAAVHRIPGYQILGKLGAGAMAVVYKAKQLSLNRTVAIKVLPKRFTENPEYVERFYKEGQAAAKLNHNNIVQAHDVGEAGGYHYFVMEYVEGKTLYDDIAAGKVFAEDEALDVIIQVARALAHAHSCGLIHRDVKPKNIMINAAGVVKLADMGLARETTDIEAAKSEAGKAYGTPYYIAPEQIRGEIDIDGRADIYGLGATFYHIVTGRVPFMADDPADVMRKHLREQLIPPDHINTSLSAGASEVIEVMMAKRKEERYNSVEELMADLDLVRMGQPPIRARKRFDVSLLEQLEDGQAVEAEGEFPIQQAVTRYRTAILILGSVIAILMLIIILLIFSS